MASLRDIVFGAAFSSDPGIAAIAIPGHEEILTSILKNTLAGHCPTQAFLSAPVTPKWLSPESSPGDVPGNSIRNSVPIPTSLDTESDP